MGLATVGGVSTSQIVFAVLILVAALERLGELVVSARRLRQRPVKRISEPLLVPVMILLHVAFLVAPAVEVWAFERPFVPLLGALSGGGLALAVALRIWTLRTLGKAWTIHVTTQPEDAVVTSGPYAWIRHPNYLVVIFELMFLPLFHTAWASALLLTLLNAGVLAFRIRTEEAVLRRNAAWQEAMADRKRLIPGLF